MENTQNDVSGISSPNVSEDVNTQTQLPVAPVVTTNVAATHAPGSSTPESNLLAALKEERARRKELEDKLNNLNTTNPTDEVYSDEGKMLAERIRQLEARDKAREDAVALERLQTQYPALKEVSEEFNEFQKDYPRHKLENVAKLFLTEKGLLDTPRKGLEKPTGGPRVPLNLGMTVEEVENLRKNDWRKYQELLRKDQLKIAS